MLGRGRDRRSAIHLHPRATASHSDRLRSGRLTGITRRRGDRNRGHRRSVWNLRSLLCRTARISQRACAICDRLRGGNRPDRRRDLVLGPWIDPHLREHFGAELRVEDRFKSLFASRTPGRTCLFGADATPNDLFPILLAEYLDEAVPTVERRHYDVDSSDSYDFRQVEISPSPAVGSTCPKLDELP